MAEYLTYGAGKELVEIAQSGDRRALLEALRDHIAERIGDGVAARDLAALSRQVRDITKELEALGDDDSADTNPDDELARRRAAVLSAAGVERADESGDAGAAGG